MTALSPNEPTAAPIYVSKATLPALAKAIAEWFPELGGRALAVSEAKITRDNIPTLPLVMVSLLREVGNHFVGTRRMEPEEHIVVEFWFRPVKYTNSSNSSETPFWAFYDYDTLRDRFMMHLRDWVSPRGERLEYFGLDVDSDQFATVTTFQLRHKFVYCVPEPYIDPCLPSTTLDGQPIGVHTFEVDVVPKQECCEPGDIIEELDECARWVKRSQLK